MSKSRFLVSIRSNMPSRGSITSNSNKYIRLFGLILVIICLGVLLSGCSTDSTLSAPGVSLSVTPQGQPQQVTTDVQLLVLLTVLSLAPAILILGAIFVCTRFLPERWSIGIGLAATAVAGAVSLLALQKLLGVNLWQTVRRKFQTNL